MRKARRGRHRTIADMSAEAYNLLFTKYGGKAAIPLKASDGSLFDTR